MCWCAGGQVSVSCRQHGDLMLVLRSRYANLCNKVSKVGRQCRAPPDLYARADLSDRC